VKAEDPKLQGAGISPKQCPRNERRKRSMYGNSVGRGKDDHKLRICNGSGHKGQKRSANNDPEWVCLPRTMRSTLATTIAPVTTPVTASCASGAQWG
jgi:hypothetical protein